MIQITNIKISFAKRFSKIYDKAGGKLKATVEKRLKLFLVNPLDPQLNNHQLVGKYFGLRSINITGDWRAIYSESVNDEGESVIIFELLGTHSQLYK